jgi:hypothetical protein
MGHLRALCPDRPGFCPAFGIDQWFQWALHNRDIVSQNESLNPISGTDFRVQKLPKDWLAMFAYPYGRSGALTFLVALYAREDHPERFHRGKPKVFSRMHHHLGRRYVLEPRLPSRF